MADEESGVTRAISGESVKGDDRQLKEDRTTDQPADTAEAADTAEEAKSDTTVMDNERWRRFVWEPEDLIILPPSEEEEEPSEEESGENATEV